MTLRRSPYDPMGLQSLSNGVLKGLPEKLTVPTRYVNDLLDERDALRASLARAVAMLRRLEWVPHPIYGKTCVLCGQTEHYGHLKDCTLSVLLADEESGN